MIELAAKKIKQAKKITAFTGAGISVESNIPPFRGEGGLWNTYNPIFLDLNYFYQNPEESWDKIYEIFYEFFGKAEPNTAHLVLAEMEKANLLHGVITQNIDNLHQLAGSKNVYEYHGTANFLVCTECGEKKPSSEKDLSQRPPLCPKCNKALKPDFVFFGEAIPAEVQLQSINEASTSDILIVVGTTGEVLPASMIPQIAKENGAFIIEINPEESLYTNSITDIYIPLKATAAFSLLRKELNLKI